MKALRRWVADRLVRGAARHLGPGREGWAEAMLAEQASLRGRPEELAWAFGLLRASLDLEGPPYPLLLIGAVGAATLYQWCADESVVTLIVVMALAALLGCLQPARHVVSGVAVGVVVASVNAFETLSGVSPDYEIYRHTWLHDAGWLWLVAPALVASAVGRRVGVTTPGHI